MVTCCHTAVTYGNAQLSHVVTQPSHTYGNTQLSHVVTQPSHTYGSAQLSHVDTQPSDVAARRRHMVTQLSLGWTQIIHISVSCVVRIYIDHLKIHTDYINVTEGQL